jgi:hypothetical protein
VWKGQNYLLKMQSDLDFLKLSDLAQLFDFPLDNNPLLLPTTIRQDSGESDNPRHTHSAYDLLNASKSKRSPMDESFSALLFEKQLRLVTSNTTRESLNSLPRLVTSNIETRRGNTTDGVRMGQKKISKLQSLLTPTLTMLTPSMMERIKQADDIIFKEDLFLKYLEQRKRKDKAAIKIQCLFRKYAAGQFAKRLREELMPQVRAKREKRKWLTMQRNKVKEEIMKEQFMKRRSETEKFFSMYGEKEDMFPAKLPPVSGRFTNNVFAMAGLDISNDQAPHHLT